MQGAPAVTLPSTAVATSVAVVPFNGSFSSVGAGAAVSGAQAVDAASIFFPFFTPSFDLALVGTVMFSGMAAVHIGLLFKTKAWYYNLLPQSALMLGLGMILRLVGIVMPTSIGSLTASSLLLMIPGSLIPLQLFFTYTRFIWWITPRQHRNISTLWLPLRATSLILGASQAVGDICSLLGSGRLFPSIGSRITAIGTLINLLVWIAFLVLVARFTIMSRTWDMSPSKRHASLELGLSLTACALFIAIRGMVQVLEKDAIQAAQATRIPNSLVISEEWPTWVFNFLPFLMVLIIQAQYYPGHYFPKRLVGPRLKTNALLQDESEGLLGDVLGAGSTHGMVISRPVPNKDDAESVVVMAYSEPYSEYMKQPVGHAR